MHVKLKVLRGASTGKEVEIRGPRFFIGRSPECNLRANSDAISRRHCAITVGESDITIKDLGSRNGTYVNGTRIDGEHRIKMGDQLRVGPLEFLVTHVAAARKTEKAPSSAPGPAPSNSSDSASTNDDDMAGLVNDWLEEADEVDRQTRSIDPETREYKMGVGDTDQMKVDVGKNNGATSQDSEPKSSEPKSSEPNSSKPNSSKPKNSEPKSKTGDTGKLSRKASKKDAPKDTQEAAAQMLRKFFNRG